MMGEGHPDFVGVILWVFNGVVGLLIALAGFLIIHTLNRLNATIDRAVERLDDHTERISRLEGFHVPRQWPPEVPRNLF